MHLTSLVREDLFDKLSAFTAQPSSHTAGTKFSPAETIISTLGLDSRGS